MFEKYDVVITNNKEHLLLDETLKKYKLYNLEEFVNNYYDNYNFDTIYYVMKKFNVIYDVAKIYVDNTRYIENKNYESSKLNFLKELKKELEDKKLLKKNKLFLSFLNGKNILFHNIEKTKEVLLLKKELEKSAIVEMLSESSVIYEKCVYQLKNIEDEIAFIANRICELFENGISFNQIVLCNLNSEYRKYVRRIFPMFNIDFELNSEDSIYGTRIAMEFLDNYNSDLNEVFIKLEEEIKTDEEGIIFNQLVDIVNKYVLVDDYEDKLSLIIRDIKKTKIKTIKYDNVVREKNLDDVGENDYVFLLGFNQGIIPFVYKDEDYLNDKEKEELGLSLTVDKNNIVINESVRLINSIKRMVITCKEQGSDGEYKISNLNEVLNYNVICDVEIPKNYSNLYNMITLTSLKDLYNKYGSTSEELSFLDSYYKDMKYMTYNNDFTGIDKKKMLEYMDNKLLLSYSSLDKYYRCPFSYYLDKVLKINVYEETFYQVIGTLFHAILQKYFDGKDSFEELWIQGKKEIGREFTAKEEFFLEKLRDELEFVIETIEYQETLTDLHDELHEEKIYTSINGNTNITFMGIVDKIKYKEVNDSTIVALIDYKTGTADIDLTMLPYGIGLQLPVYIYLARNNKKFKNVKVAGFYLQKIVNNESSNNDNKDYKEIRRKNLLLQGYSNADTSILYYMDNSYEDSKLIKSMKVKKDGDFSSYAKVLTEKEMDIIERIVVQKIEEGSKKICDADFAIAPKSIDNKNISCTFCKFGDVCYRKNEDIVNLKKLSQEEILGGDYDGMD